MRHDFAASLVRTLWFQVGVFSLAFLMMLAWPRGVGRKGATPGDAGLAAGRQSAEMTAGQAAQLAPGTAPGGSAEVTAGPGVSAAASNGQVT